MLARRKATDAVSSEMPATPGLTLGRSMALFNLGATVAAAAACAPHVDTSARSCLPPGAIRPVRNNPSENWR